MSEMTEDEWEDITHCGKLTPTITATLCMAGGGSHAWNYVLEWTNLHDDEPRVYIERFPFENKENTNQTAILRHEGHCSAIKLVPFGYDMPEDTDEVCYSRIPVPNVESEPEKLTAELAMRDKKISELEMRLGEAETTMSHDYVSLYNITGGKDYEYIDKDEVYDYLKENHPDIDLKLWKLHGGNGMIHYFELKGEGKSDS